MALKIARNFHFLLLEKNINLLIIRTPLQAWIVGKVLEKESIKNFDLIYITQDKSQEDNHYFKLLAKMANNSSYVFVRRQKFDVLNSILLRMKLSSWYHKKDYNTIIYASITSLIANSLIANSPLATLITFDDGAANIVESDQFSNESESKRYLFYRRVFGSLSLDVIRSRILKHYTLYPNFKNIVESERLVNLPTWNTTTDSNLDAKTYFIGSPFQEIMTEQKIQRLEGYLRKLPIDFYVLHPREIRKLDIDVVSLDKKGLIAEEAIISDAKSSPIILIGWFSTVLLNISALCKECIVLLPEDSVETPELFALSEKMGFTPILI